MVIPERTRRKDGAWRKKRSDYGKKRYKTTPTNMNDDTYMSIASHVHVNSTCKKKHLGCVLVTTSGHIIKGTNGAPAPIEPCDQCPRINTHGGQELHLCKAVHAERATLLTAAREGIPTKNATLYSDMGVPCGDCLLELCAAGIKEIVCSRGTFYDEKSKRILYEWIKKGLIFRIHNHDPVVDEGMTMEELLFNNTMSEHLSSELMK